MIKSCFIYACGLFSFLILIVGIALSLSNVFSKLVESVVEKEIVLKNGTDAFDAWEDPPAPIYMQFYFFNLTNPLEVLDGDRPAVLEIGPYTYREYRPMEEVIFHDNGTKVAAVNTKTYIFQPDMSRGPESELIRTVNVPAVTLMERFKDSPFFANLISSYMKDKDEGLFTTRTVGELLWGYEDVLLKAIHTLSPDVDPVFGLFYKRNASDDGEYVFLTGQEDYKDFARLDTWNNQRSLNWWTSDECNMINGTNGASFHSVLTKNEMLYMFSSDLCRSIYAVFEKDVAVKGIPGYRFAPPSQVFANSSVNPSNAGFCVPADNCLGSGVLNVKPCKQGAPIIMSSPHFYQGDEKFVRAVFGMKPHKEYHQTFIDLNPLTGVVLRAAKRLQVNVYVEKMNAFSQTGTVTPVILPVLYLNESVVIDDSSAAKVNAVLMEQKVLINVPFILMGIGIILGGIFMLLVCRHKMPESTAAERQPLLESLFNGSHTDTGHLAPFGHHEDSRAEGCRFVSADGSAVPHAGGFGTCAGRLDRLGPADQEVFAVALELHEAGGRQLQGSYGVCHKILQEKHLLFLEIHLKNTNNSIRASVGTTSCCFMDQINKKNKFVSWSNIDTSAMFKSCPFIYLYLHTVNHVSRLHSIFLYFILTLKK